MAVADEEIIRRLRTFKGAGTNLSRTAANRIERLRAALKAAKTEIEWWVEEHGCCDGHQDEAMKLIALALEQKP